METEQAYILGTDDQELARLGFQHKVWTEQAYAVWRSAGLRAGDHVLDLGCGPGFITLELAQLVGHSGRVIAHDRSRRFLQYLEAECRRLRLSHVQTLLGEAESLSLPPNSLDAVYSRWLFCWLPDPFTVLDRVARALKPGGAVILQDYIDWGAMKVIPPSAAHARAKEACMESWKRGGSIINIADRVPELAQRAGLTVERFRPVARLGPEASPEWGWVIGFLRSYLPNLLGTLYSQAELDAFHAEFPWPPSRGSRFIYTPTVADVVLRKPTT